MTVKNAIRCRVNVVAVDERKRETLNVESFPSRIRYSVPSSSILPIRLVDFFFEPRRPIIFFHVLSPRFRGLHPPMSLDGGVVGGVIGSR